MLSGCLALHPFYYGGAPAFIATIGINNTNILDFLYMVRIKDRKMLYDDVIEYQKMAKAQILLVTDNAEQSVMYERMLILSGYEVIVARDADSAIAILTTDPINLALIDFTLQGMSGKELITYLRTKDIQSKLVLMNINEDLRRHAREAGADGWFDKLSGLNVMAQMVESLLDDQPNSV
jgi:CheY-like chemotaxis protein